jgi:hypothetical protein
MVGVTILAIAIALVVDCCEPLPPDYDHHLLQGGKERQGTAQGSQSATMTTMMIAFDRTPLGGQTQPLLPFLSLPLFRHHR